MHKTTVPYIYKDNIKWLVNEFLKEFGVKYPNVSLKMLIVGGSALAIKYGIRGTVDIDADIKTEKGIKRLIKSVADRLGVYDDFINCDFMYSTSYSKHLWSDAILLYKNTLYEIYVVSDLSQLCMKIVSGRRKDYEDLKCILFSLIQKGYRFGQVERRLEELYNDRVAVNLRFKRYVHTMFKRAKQL